MGGLFVLFVTLTCLPRSTSFFFLLSEKIDGVWDNITYIQADISTLFEQLHSLKDTVSFDNQTKNHECNCASNDIEATMQEVLRKFVDFEMALSSQTTFQHELQNRLDEIENMVSNISKDVSTLMSKSENETSKTDEYDKELSFDWLMDDLGNIDHFIKDLDSDGDEPSLDDEENIEKKRQSVTANVTLRSCLDASSSSFYYQHFESINSTRVVSCDADTDDGGWTVIMRRMGDPVDFNRTWNDYKYGFGNIDGDFWIGNEILHELTKSAPIQLRTEMEDIDGTKIVVTYEKFQIGSEATNYKLAISGFHGTLGAALISHNGMNFSTFDMDNDQDPDENCANQESHGGWWFGECLNSLLTGKYEFISDRFIEWESPRLLLHLGFADMKIRKTTIREPITIAGSLQSCEDAPSSGYYEMYFESIASKRIVSCDADTDGGGWIVFMRRQDGSVGFYRTWNEYKQGFGNIAGEFWIGNEILYELTKYTPMELRIEMEDLNGTKLFVTYNRFQIGSEANKYKLMISGFHGAQFDALDYHNGMSFSTFDSDNDKNPDGNCAEFYLYGGWWYGSCINSLLTGNFDLGVTENGITWSSANLKFVEIKIRNETFKGPLTAIRTLQSCSDATRNGIYDIYFESVLSLRSVNCDAETDGGGWIVTMRRHDGSVDFNRTWNEYKRGFGRLDGNFWIGNELLHELTKSGPIQLRIEMENLYGNKSSVMYDKFQIGSEVNKYKLMISGFHGTVSDALAYHNGMNFSTYDADNDQDPDENCANRDSHGGWWFGDGANRGWWSGDCFTSLLTGRYDPGYRKIAWDWYYLKFVEMKVR